MHEQRQNEMEPRTEENKRHPCTHSVGNSPSYAVNLLVRASEFIWTPASLIIARPVELCFSVPGANGTTERHVKWSSQSEAVTECIMETKKKRFPFACACLSLCCTCLSGCQWQLVTCAAVINCQSNLTSELVKTCGLLVSGGSHTSYDKSLTSGDVIRTQRLCQNCNLCKWVLPNCLSDMSNVSHTPVI